MNIQDFMSTYGLGAIVRRHFSYTMPVSNGVGIGGIGQLAAGLVYSRALDPAKLGLDMDGMLKAVEQGTRLSEMVRNAHVMPINRFICGADQRNMDGARLTAEAYRREDENYAKRAKVDTTAVRWLVNPALTYPYYADAVSTKSDLKQYGDYAVHKTLTGELISWTESPETFEARIVSAIMTDSQFAYKPFFDLNFEALVLLYYLHVKKIARKDIPSDKSAWCPTKGGGLVYSADFSVVKEFTPDLEIVG